jgi:HD-like signal output (HDOD) protein
MGGTGSRNIEAVKQCLAALKIHLVQARTGGSQGLRVRVCIDDGKIDTQPTPSIAKQLHRRSAGWNPPQRLRKEILSQLEQLRCDNSVCGQLARDLRASQIDWPGALERINQDPVLVLSLLRLGNSVSCGKPGQIDSPASGLSCLGAEGFLRICKSAIGQTSQGTGLSDLGITPHRFSSHAIETARLARGHARKHRPELADLVHTAGLLHGLRPVVVALASGAGSNAGQYVTSPATDQSRGIGASLWGQLTASVLLEWNLPPLLVRAISGPGPQHDSQLGSSLERLIVSCCRLASQSGSVDAGKYRCPWHEA